MSIALAVAMTACIVVPAARFVGLLGALVIAAALAAVLLMRGPGAEPTDSTVAGAALPAPTNSASLADAAPPSIPAPTTPPSGPARKVLGAGLLLAFFGVPSALVFGLWAVINSSVSPKARLCNLGESFGAHVTAHCGLYEFGDDLRDVVLILAIGCAVVGVLGSCWLAVQHGND